MLEKELSLKGWNWGTAKFYGSVLSFDVGHNTAFEIPLYDVSQCTTGKNEVTLEFHQVSFSSLLILYHNSYCMLIEILSLFDRMMMLLLV